jgi:hypothetical protein
VSQAEAAIAKAYKALSLTKASSEERYQRIAQIVAHLEQLNSKRKFKGATTGRITELLCQLALDATLHDRFSKLAKEWEWLGDFSLQGVPFNLLVSVKSFTAKERLIASGSRSLLIPTVGWGLLKEASEWTVRRTQSYVFAGFVAIYLPRTTLEEIGSDAKSVLNVNGHRLLRGLDEFLPDLRSWQDTRGLVDIRRI